MVLHGTPLSDGALRRRNFRTVGLLAALFMLPLALSFFLYFSGWRPPGQAIHGQLIDPVRTLPVMSLRDPFSGASGHVFPATWTLVYVGNGACEADCREALFAIRQSRLLLNQDMKRVSRVFLATDHCCNGEYLRSEHPGLLTFDASVPEARPLLASFPSDHRATSIFIVDPLGNLVLREDASADPEGLLDDLRKLLRLSHIG